MCQIEAPGTLTPLVATIAQAARHVNLPAFASGVTASPASPWPPEFAWWATARLPHGSPEVVVAAEERFGVKIPDDAVTDLATVGDAVNFIVNAAK